MRGLLLRPELEAPLGRRVEVAVAVEVDSCLADGMAPRLATLEVSGDRTNEIEDHIWRILQGGSAHRERSRVLGPKDDLEAFSLREVGFEPLAARPPQGSEARLALAQLGRPGFEPEDGLPGGRDSLSGRAPDERTASLRPP